MTPRAPQVHRRHHPRISRRQKRRLRWAILVGVVVSGLLGWMIWILNGGGPLRR